MIRDVSDLAVGGNGIGAPHEKVLGVLHVVIAIIPIAFRHACSQLLGFSADGGMSEVVRRSEHFGKHFIEKICQPGRTALRKHELMGLIRGAQLHQLIGDGVERLIPADGNETRILTTALLGVGSLEGNLNPVGVVHLLQGKMRTWADEPSI